MPLSTYLRAALGGHVWRGVPYTAPGTVFIGLHTATTTSAGASSGASTISVTHAVASGASITIDPSGTPQARTVTGVAGSGPYTLTLNSALTGNVASGVAVSFEPDPAGTTLKPPSGGAYARAGVLANTTNWTTAIDNAVVITYPQATATWGLVTHFTVHDAASGGNLLQYGPLTTPVMINAGQTASVPVGELDVVFT